MKEITLKGTIVKREDNKKVYKLNLGKLEWKQFYNIDDDLYLCIEEEILDYIEKEYLRAVIRPFRDRVKHIRKNFAVNDREYISINVNGEWLVFPYFTKGTMYKGMEINKRYSLEELGL